MRTALFVITLIGGASVNATEVPALSFDKAKLPNVRKLDAMYVVAKEQEALYNLAYPKVRELQDASRESMSYSSLAEALQKIQVKVDAVRNFEEHGKPVIDKALKVSAAYGDDGKFQSLYRDTYVAAETDIMGTSMGGSIVPQGPGQRKVWTEFRNGYPAAMSTHERSLQDLLKQAEELRAEIVGQVLSGAGTDLMVADYQKGKGLADLLQGTLAKLDVVAPLDPKNAGIQEMRAKVAEKKKSRLADIQQGREAYRFPARYAAANAPGNAAELEQRMKAFLGKSPSGDYQDLRKIVVAGPWVEVLHPLSGRPLYKQVDFYVAVKYPKGEAGVIDVLYVTGKTGSADNSAFAVYSVGGLGQMLEKNL